LAEYKVFIFDFDGVVVDSLPLRDQGFYKAFLPYGVDAAKKAYDYHIQTRGVKRRDKFAQILGKILEVSYTSQDIDDIESRFAEFIDRGLLDSPLLVDRLQLLCLSKNFPVNIVSTAPKEEVLKLAKHAGIVSFFRRIYGGSDTKYTHIDLIIDELQCPRNQVVFVGDSYKDYEAAVKSKVNFIGIVKKNNNSVFPDKVETFESLSDFIKQLNF